MLTRFISLCLVLAAFATAGSAVATGAVVTPSPGNYLGADHLNETLRFSLSRNHHVVNFKWRGIQIFASVALHGNEFTFVGHGYRVRGHWTSNHFVEGTIFHHDAGYAFDANQVAF